jgi:hypothetical protein
MSRNIHRIFISLLLLLMTGSLVAQTTSDTTRTQGRAAQVQSSGSVVDLTTEAVRIKAEPERPRVNIIAERIKPEFDNINLERSFMPELLGKGEKIVVIGQPLNTDLIERIDIEKTLSKTRY